MTLPTEIISLRKVHLFLDTRPASVALTLALFSIALHFPFALFSAFGEQDAARLALRALRGYQNGLLQMGGQWPFSYPLYIHFLYGILKWELIRPSELPAVMTGLSLFAGGAFTSGFFLFFHRITGATLTVAAAAVLLQLTPVFWFACIYGFPTIVALAFFITAAWLFGEALLDTASSRRRIVLGVTAPLLFAMGVFVKVDVITAAALFCLPIWQQSRHPARRWGGAIGVLLFTLFAFFLLNRYGETLSTGEGASESWRNWTGDFFGGFKAVFSQSHIRIIHRALGAVTPFAAFIGVVILFTRNTQRTTVFWTAAAAAPSALFWSVVAGNSARHNLILGALVPLFVALPMAQSSNRFKKWWAVALLSMLLFNYSWFPISPSTVAPSGRLIESSLAFRDQALVRRQTGRKLAAMKDDKIIVIVQSHKIPYYIFEILTAESMTIKKQAPGLIITQTKDGNSPKVYRFPEHGKLRAMGEFEAQGYRVVWLYNRL